MGRKDKPGTGLGKPFMETRPGPTEMEIYPAAVRVEIDNVLNEQVDMIVPSVPEPEVKKVIGANLSPEEQERKNKYLDHTSTYKGMDEERERGKG